MTEMLVANALVLAGRIGFSALFLIGGVFNLTYGRAHPEEFYGSFRDSAWLKPYPWLLREVIVPQGARFAVLLGAFELAVGGLIVVGGSAMAIGLVAGIAFVLLVVPASNLPGALGNLAVAAGQAVLLWSELAG